MICLAAWLGLFSCVSHNAHAQGASTSFASLEAEDGVLGGGATVVSLGSAPVDKYSSPVLEASQHAYVQLTGNGQYVQWTNNTGQSITAVNLRYCIPDAPTGWGISSTINMYVNGVFRQSFNVNSKQNYVYEGVTYGAKTDKNPADGHPINFWNDEHEFITGAAVAPGSTIRFEKDAANSATFYYIDVVDLENPPGPLPQPANSLSILNYGAVSNNPAADNTAAMNNCFNAAQSQGKIAWIPPGIFYMSSTSGGLQPPPGTIIEGAGPWYTTIYRTTLTNATQFCGIIAGAYSITMENMLLDCNDWSGTGDGAVTCKGTNWLFNNLWIQHVGAAFWCAGVGGTVKNCRELNIWADGGNFNNVQDQNPSLPSSSLVFSNNFIRGTGDDSMAMNSVNTNGATQYPIMSNITYANNTAIGAWGGHNMGLYGGTNIYVKNNLLKDSARFTGLSIGTFGNNGSPIQSAVVSGNVLYRCGGNGYNQQQPAVRIGLDTSLGSVANVTFSNNIINSSVFTALGISTSTNISVANNTVNFGWLDGIVIGLPNFPANSGSAQINSNTVAGLGTGRVAFTNASSTYTVTQMVGNSWQSQAPAAPTGLTATAGNAQVTLAWTASPGATGYNVKNSTNSGGPYTVITSNVTSVSYTNTGLVNEKVYYYVVSALNGSGESANSSEAAVAPGALSRSGWVASSSTSGGDVPSNALDGNPATRWSTGASQTNGQWFQVDMGSARSFNELVLEAEASPGDYPRGYQVNVSSDGSNWGSPVATGAGSSSVTMIAFAAQTARYIRVTQTSSGVTGNWWSIHEFNVYGTTAVPPAPTNLNPTPGNGQVSLSWSAASGATSYNVKSSTNNGGPYNTIVTGVTSLSYTNTGLANGTPYFYVVSSVNGSGEGANCPQVSAAPGALSRSGWVASASCTENGGSPANAIDGNVSTRWSSGANQTNGMWFQVDMASAQTFYQIVLENCASAGDYPRGYQVNISSDGTNWGSAVATGTANSSVTVITFATQTARYIRVTETVNSGPWWSIHEFSVYSSLPSPWQNQDIGSVGLAGSSSYATNTFTVEGSGSDIQGSADAFQYVDQASSADCSMVAKVLSVQNTDPWAKAGVMIRETTAAGAINAGMFVTPGSGITFQWRTNTGGGTSWTSQGGSAPYWVKLTRVGNAFAGYYSPDGTTWTQMGTTQTLPMATNATIGLAVTAHNNTSFCTATFNNVTASP